MPVSAVAWADASAIKDSGNIAAMTKSGQRIPKPRV
jgi:hypothetical protein